MSKSSPPKVDLHGLTKEEALTEVDRELNHSFIDSGEERRLCFITGWGGILRQEVKKFLMDHPLVKKIDISGSTITIVLEDLQ